MPLLIVPSAVRARGFPERYALAWPDKAAVDRDLYTLDVANWLAEMSAPGGASDTVVGAAVTVTPTVFGSVVVEAVTLFAAGASAWLSGGISGQTYDVVYTLTTAAGRTHALFTRLAVEVPP